MNYILYYMNNFFGVCKKLGQSLILVCGELSFVAKLGWTRDTISEIIVLAIIMCAMWRRAVALFVSVFRCARAACKLCNKRLNEM